MKALSPEKRLEQEYKEVLETLEKLREEMRSEVEFDADEYSPELYEREKTVSTIQMLEHQLDAIEVARQRLKMGQYGICQDCGQAIEPGRLEIVPEATLCLTCKGKAERRFL